MKLLDLGSTPIFDQLQLEEALLRGTTQDFCIINRGSPRAIVMGISGEPEELLHLDKVKRDSIPVIKRFSGGGTVIVDEETLFITFILNKTSLPTEPFPEPILRWTGDLYQKSWQIPTFHLIENDYAIGEKKCGGNAQYIQRDRILHHTSFLWNYHPHNMDYLLLPKKRPNYRQSRAHTEFLCCLKDHAPSQAHLITLLQNELKTRFPLTPIHRTELSWKPHRESVEQIFVC